MAFSNHQFLPDHIFASSESIYFEPVFRWVTVANLFFFFWKAQDSIVVPVQEVPVEFGETSWWSNNYGCFDIMFFFWGGDFLKDSLKVLWSILESRVYGYC